MNHPRSELTSNGGVITYDPAESSWGEKETAREIALLEALVLEDDICRAIETAFHAVENGHSASEHDPGYRGTGSLAREIIPVDVDGEVKQSYLDYAMYVIMDGHVSLSKAVTVLRTLSRRALRACPYLSHRLAAALAIRQITSAQKNLSSLLSRLSQLADAAFYRVPLFADGPELSEFRHRHR
ncbi:hypothetical protein [Pseudomonas batumici]|uniref:hypothetical protein n=1 Tax=Pseudomonas batumici TaxID=226910 RepID=UPI000589FAF4|nr:hypothetical protein [Pseudomonas batumici]